MKEKRFKICIACCPGGHMVQAKHLACVYEKYDHFYVTYPGGVAEGMRQVSRVRTVPDVLRSRPLSWFKGIIVSLYVAGSERPDIVITTGAGAVVFFCIFAKMLGAKLIFIESMAKVKTPTLTARFMYPLADLFLVQWPNLLPYFPRAKYYGRLL
ncbi:MAG: polysaccharide biosynthesis protein [Sedimentisphaerales bacterium]|nr:polysaccharide biosynthesis protein [Sedimentisphaerales bacterium]